MNVKKTTLLLFMLILFTMFNFRIIAFAEGNKTTQNEIDKISANRELFVEREGYDNGLPNVTIEDASDWVDRKGSELIEFLQKFAQPYSIIIFIICAFLALSGVVVKGKQASAGIWGMVIVVIVYAVICLLLKY